MGTMIPSDIEEFTTEGEHLFYEFLHAVAKPDSEFIIWYTPDIEGKEPDFILFSNRTGLIVFEVKDWGLDQVIHADPHRFKLLINTKEETRENPLRQAKSYFFDIKEKIEKDGKFLSADPRFHGKIKIPINYGVIFPNINKFNYEQKCLDKVIATNKVFFNDDINPQSDICADTSGKKFCEFLEHKFSPRFPCELNNKEIQHLKQLLFPEVNLVLPERGEDFETHKKRISQLDLNQESLARKFDGGHRIIRGPSGSGKTIILVHKVAMLQKYNPKIKKILFVCFNITLVDYLKRLLSNQKVRLGEGKVEVYHFFQLCAKILEEDIKYDELDPAYYDMVLSEALLKSQAKNIVYDAILVDEGQDLSDDMYKLVMSLLNPKTNSLTIALDEHQNIYRRTQTWKNLGIDARGRVHTLTNVYRNTKQIAELASNFIKKEAPSDATPNTPKQLLLFDNLYQQQGQKPLIQKFSTYDEILKFMVDTVFDFRDRNLCPLGEIAVLYTKLSLTDTSLEYPPESIIKYFSNHGLFTKWSSKDITSKENYDITSDKITVSSIHSAKGFDYDSLFLLGIDTLDGSGWTEEEIINLVYIAITRARHWLFIPYMKENSVIKKLLASISPSV